MKLINPTFKKYPAQTADAIYGRKLSQAFQKILGDDFLLIVIKNEGEELSGINTKVFTLPSKYFRFVRYIAQLFLFLFKNKKTHKETVFFSNDYTLICFLLLLRKFLFLKYSVCVDWHMFGEDWKDAYMARNADLHITTTEQLKGLIVEKFGTDDRNIFVAYGGVDEKLFESRESKNILRSKLSLPEDSKLIGYVGFFKTLGMSKGIDTMIRSLTHLSQDYRMVFVGGKQKEIDFYVSLAEELGVLDRCLFRGVLPQEEIILYEQALDILAIPYPKQPHFEKYGFPMKTYEYMLSRNPIVYSDLSILHEVLRPFGFSFQADNPVDLARVIKYVENNENECQEKINLAERMALELTWFKKARAIITFIKHNLHLD